jgi:hypothetical protein
MFVKVPLLEDKVVRMEDRLHNIDHIHTNTDNAQHGQGGGGGNYKL